MTLTISGKNMDIGSALRTRIQDRIAAAVDKYFDASWGGHVVVMKDGGGFRTDCALHLDSGIVLKASADSWDATASFDQTADRIEKRLRRYKRRLKSRHPEAGAAPDGTEAASFVVAAPEEDEEAAESYSPVIVAETATRIRVLTVGMAVLELDLTGEPVIVFRNASDGGLNVVYRRSDGNYGWIDPRFTPARAD